MAHLYYWCVFEASQTQVWQVLSLSPWIYNKTYKTIIEINEGIAHGGPNATLITDLLFYLDTLLFQHLVAVLQCVTKDT